MSIVLEKFNEAQKKFSENDDVMTGKSIVKKIEMLINEIGSRFETMMGDEISEKQVKLCGYKFYLATSISDMLLKAKFLENYINVYKAENWNRIKCEIEDERGKVKNKEEIENQIIIEIKDTSEMKIFYNTEYEKLKTKSIATSEILTALCQKKAELSREIEQSKQY